VVLVGGATSAPAEFGSSVNYNFLIASGFLCDPNEPSTCPAVARNSNGDTIEISGAGTLSLANDSVMAAGAFTQKTYRGEVAATGIWTAIKLLSFGSYGAAPGVLLRNYHQKFRSSGMFSMGLNIMAGPMPAGGLAVIRIRLLPDSGRPKDAVLEVNCAKGKVPDDHQEEGVRLTIEGEGVKFDEQVGGRTVFMLRRPGPSSRLRVPRR
jgi:hypothetical protein